MAHPGALLGQNQTLSNTIKDQRTKSIQKVSNIFRCAHVPTSEPKVKGGIHCLVLFNILLLLMGGIMHLNIQYDVILLP